VRDIFTAILHPLTVWIERLIVAISCALEALNLPGVAYLTVSN
jgi:hypothetical protein